MSQNLNLNPKTGDYVVENGKPVNTDSLTIPAYIRLKAKRKRWLYAPDDNWGSDLYLIKKVRTDQSPTLIENLAASALQPIVDDGRATQISVDTVAVARGGVAIDAQITDASGREEKLVLPPIV